jgi:uncharacterized protein (DUF1800 family)
MFTILKRQLPLVRFLSCIVFVVSVALVGRSPLSEFGATAASPPSDDRAIAHLLNRIGYGPRPGDIEMVRKVGVQSYIDGQLHPDRISDSIVEAKLSAFPTLTMSTREIAQKYYLPVLEARRARKREEVREANASGSSTQMDEEKSKRASKGDPQDMDEKGAPKKALDPEAQKAREVLAELSQQKLLRAVYSERQLQEVLTDFWFNHFNVFAGKGPDRILLTSYERDAIRPHVLGKFRDLLQATARSPAMLFYLDNWLSTDPNGPHASDGDRRRGGRFGGRRRGGFGGLGRPTAQRPNEPQAQQTNNKRGLNENYGRELMELHTLGVDGGYSQKDVTEVARCFTGWTIANPREGGGFRYDPRLHDEGEKVVLGRRIKAGGGEKDGEAVLDLLSNHPSTARFISTKLARRFVSDTPPQTLIDRATAAFLKTGGDIREVVRTIITAPEFFAPESYRAKVKTPLEFVASALRITGAQVDNALPVAKALQQLGMPLYLCQPPTGYADKAEAWVNTGALVNRMNFALALASNQLPGIRIDPQRVVGPEASIDDLAFVRVKLVETILSNDASDATVKTLDKARSVPQMAALTLGAPEFQRR